MDIAFNEGSLDKIFVKAQTRQDARNTFLEFVKKINEMKKDHLIDNIFFTYDVINYDLSKGYTVRDWLHDNTINMNFRHFFKSCLDRVVYVQKTDICCEAKVQYPSQEIESVGCAFIKDYSDNPTVISISTHEFWESEELPVAYEYLDEDGEIQDEQICIKNISRKTDIKFLKNKKRAELFNNISSGQDFWDNKERLFPNLVFCESVKRQVYEDCERYHIIKVMERLNKMQEYFSQAHQVYNPAELGMDARTESETVKNDSYLRKKRLFRLPTGENKYFFDHVGFTGKYKGGRIHFYPDVQNMRAFIGYIGRHLETKKFS